MVWMTKSYWVSRNGSAQGPYDTADLQVLLNEGKIAMTDQVRRQQGDHDWFSARAVLDKPSLLERELSRLQARQAGIAARLLMVGALIVSGIHGLGNAQPVVYVLVALLVTTLVAVQMVKGPVKVACINLGLAWVVTPLLCLLLAWLRGWG